VLLPIASVSLSFLSQKQLLLVSFLLLLNLIFEFCEHLAGRLLPGHNLKSTTCVISSDVIRRNNWFLEFILRSECYRVLHFSLVIVLQHFGLRTLCSHVVGIGSFLQFWFVQTNQSWVLFLGWFIFCSPLVYVLKFRNQAHNWGAFQLLRGVGVDCKQLRFLLI